MKATSLSALVLAALLCLCLTAVAQGERTNVVYGVYALEGEHPDSLIRATLTVDGEDTITDLQFDEALIAYAASGAEGWAALSEENAALLGENVVSAGQKSYPAYFLLGGVTWTGTADEGGAITYTGSVDGASTDLMDYIVTPEGGAWYFASLADGAALLDAEGSPVATVEIGTKTSINHGVGFWPSDITFPGNIERITDFIKAHGIHYAYYPDGGDIYMGEDGTWQVIDATSGATLAGTPNYLNLAKQAYEALIAE